MCGIAGEIRLDKAASSANLVEQMLDTMVSRGPDGSGVFRKDHVTVGHRRLKIIDLSDQSAQPMVDRQLGLAIVFNGAIYNYQDLRRELEEKGYTFFSQGDTEVILKAFHCWGADCVAGFNGMFAFAVLNLDSGAVTLARDRLGIKPLYYHQSAGQFCFASTLQALLKVPSVDTQLDPVALNYYLSFHAVVPAPHTILKGIRKVPPATVMTISPSGESSESTYWQLRFTRTAETTAYCLEDWKRLLHHQLLQSVKRRLNADVPVGVLLSGGLDSSLIVGLLHEAGQQGIQTFSVGFGDVGGESGNEFQYSDIIAKHYGTTHHKIFADDTQVQENLMACIRGMLEPMVSHDVIGFYLLSKEVSRHVKVVQSGQGADEVFAGYHWYPPMMTVNGADAVTTYQNAFFDRRFQEMQQVVHPDYLVGDCAYDFVAAHFNQSGADLPIDKALRLDSTIMLVDDPVKRVDNMTMAWHLEARVPFLDHELVEFAATMPPEMKLPDGGKYVLKALGRDLIPNAVIDRPKGYFPMPALKYLQGPYYDTVNDVLNSTQAKQRGVFQSEYVTMLLSAPSDYITPLRGSKLWQIALLELWLQEVGV